MAKVTVVYWRDIPAQVLVGRGRNGAKVVLPGRFEKAIDRAAMKSGLSGTDDYLGEWRKAVEEGGEGSPQEIAEAAARRLDAAHSPERLKALSDAGGRASSDA